MLSRARKAAAHLQGSFGAGSKNCTALGNPAGDAVPHVHEFSGKGCVNTWLWARMRSRRVSQSGIWNLKSGILRKRVFSITLLLECNLDSPQEFPIIEWLGQELDRAALHRLSARRNVAVSGNKDDRKPVIRPD